MSAGIAAAGYGVSAAWLVDARWKALAIGGGLALAAGAGKENRRRHGPLRRRPFLEGLCLGRDRHRRGPGHRLGRQSPARRRRSPPIPRSARRAPRCAPAAWGCASDGSGAGDPAWSASAATGCHRFGPTAAALVWPHPPCSVPGVCSRSLSPCALFLAARLGTLVFPAGRGADRAVGGAVLAAGSRHLDRANPGGGALAHRARRCSASWLVVALALAVFTSSAPSVVPIRELATRATAPLLAAALAAVGRRRARRDLAAGVAMGRPRLPPSVRELRPGRSQPRRRARRHAVRLDVPAQRRDSS